ncbi:hypothetical protein LARV_00773 [Longilinea arvoryzae]|uniref:Uncharacterized protein n=1 Tax=Longilinea arvoryzae TaxID=360412 RepID=A0A0S7BFY8_9CHLR|nr:hypothetical protein [Longilinea arvoryzae]GAP13032.1 hypothetical protein LARV_00773 [Longilinea arvoryzae]
MKRRLSWFLALSVLLLTGCIDSYPKPAPRSLMDINHSATADSQLAIAVDSGGAKYLLHAECPSGSNPSCELTYEMTHIGEVGVLWYFTPASGYTFRNPDIVVTDSGPAYMIWQNCPANNVNGRECSTWYTTSDQMDPQVLDLGTHSLSAPILASRGDTVYAVHEVTNDYATGSVLRFCRISDAGFGCHFVSDHPVADDGIRRTNPAAAVSTAGSLHVAWLQGSGNSKTGYLNDNYGAVDVDMAHELQYETGPFFPPAISIESDDGYLYIAMAADESSSDWMRLYYCAPSDCKNVGGLKTIDLPAAKSWYFYGGPAIASTSDRVWIVFSAHNNDHINQGDLYMTACYPNGSTCTPSRLEPFYTGTDHACHPRIGLVDGLVPVIGWHICGFPTMADDIYFYDLVNGKKIIHSTDWNGRGGLDMAVNGEYVAGIWNEIQSDGRLATWLAFNAHMTYIPAVRK